MVVPCKLSTSLLVLSLLRLYESFVIEPTVSIVKPKQTLLFLFDGERDAVSRRQLFQFAAALAPAALVTGASPAKADVSDGNALPQGAQQFARVVKLQTDLKVRVNNVPGSDDILRSTI
jgi:hypothetical protein